MTQIHPTLLLLLIEAVGVLTLLLGVWLVLAWLRRRRERKAVETLIAAVTEGAAARAESNAGVIGTALGLEGDELAARVKHVENAQKLLLQRVVLGWSQRDAASVATLLDPLEALAACWRGMLGETGGRVSSAGDDAELATRLEELEMEKAMVEEELVITRATMDRMLHEYAAMYQRGDGGDNSAARALLATEPDAGEDAAGAVQELPRAPAADDGEDIEVQSTVADETAAEAPPAAADAAPRADDEAVEFEFDPGDDTAAPAAAAGDETAPDDAASPVGGAADTGQAAAAPAARSASEEDADDVQRMQDELETLFDMRGDDDELAGDLLAGLDDEDPFGAMDDEGGAGETVQRRAAAETAAARG